MLNTDDKIIKEKQFVFNKIQYTARLYSHGDKSMLYGEIVYSETNQRVHNMKGLARDFLKPYGINVPTDAKTMVTHNAVALLIKTLEENQG